MAKGSFYKYYPIDLESTITTVVIIIVCLIITGIFKKDHNE